jgi:hypothetical protein
VGFHSTRQKKLELKMNKKHLFRWISGLALCLTLGSASTLLAADKIEQKPITLKTMGSL